MKSITYLISFCIGAATMMIVGAPIWEAYIGGVLTGIAVLKIIE